MRFDPSPLSNKKWMSDAGGCFIDSNLRALVYSNGFIWILKIMKTSRQPEVLLRLGGFNIKEDV